MVLAPMIPFIYLFMSATHRPEEIWGIKPFIIIGFLLILVATDWLLASRSFNRNLKKARKLPTLVLKLERYYLIIIFRFALGSAACLLLAIGFYLTTDSIFSALFLIALVIFFSLWPKPVKVCRDLKLKGDERRLVLSKNTKTQHRS